MTDPHDDMAELDEALRVEYRRAVRRRRALQEMADAFDRICDGRRPFAGLCNSKLRLMLICRLQAQFPDLIDRALPLIIAEYELPRFLPKLEDAGLIEVHDGDGGWDGVLLGLTDAGEQTLQDMCRRYDGASADPRVPRPRGMTLQAFDQTAAEAAATIADTLLALDD